MIGLYQSMMWGMYHATLDAAISLKPEGDWVMPRREGHTDAMLDLLDRARSYGLDAHQLGQAAKAYKARYFPTGQREV